MRRTLCQPRIQRGTLTGAERHHEGILTVDHDLMDAADMLTGEKVQMVDVDTVARPYEA